MRSYRGAEQREPPAGAGRDVGAPRAGAARVAEGVGSRASRATWKVDRQRPADRPDRRRRRRRDFEAFANGDDGPPLGRELELADLLRVHQGAAHPQRRLDHRRRPLLRRAPLPSVAREVHRVRSVLGVRRRPAQRRHVRPEHAGRDVRPRGEVHRHPAGHEAEPAAERRASSSSAGCSIDRRTKAMTVTLHDLSGQGAVHAGAGPADSSTPGTLTISRVAALAGSPPRPIAIPDP